MMIRVLVILLIAVLLALPGYAQAPGEEPGPPIGQAPQGEPPGPPDGPPGEGPEGPRRPPEGGRWGAEGGREGRPGRPLTPEVEAKFLAFMKQIDPSSSEELSRLKAQNPQQYQRVLAEGAERMQMLSEMQKRDPAAYQDMVNEIRLEGSARRIGESYRNASADKKAALKDQLRQVLGQLFDAREANRKHQIDRLEKDLASMKATLGQRAKNKAAIVNRRLDDMLSEPATAW